MATSLELWIKELESQLTKLPPGEREAVMSEIQKVLHRPNQKSFVANDYNESKLNQTHTQPIGHSARRFFKFATFLVLGFFVLLVILIFMVPIMLFKFISVDNFQRDWSFSWSHQPPQLTRVDGKIQSSVANQFTFTLTNGQISVVTEPSAQEISYDCEVDSPNPISPEEVAKIENRSATLSLLNVENAECELTVPPKIPISINLSNGEIELTEMSQQVEANLTNGEIEFSAAESAAFDLQAHVVNGITEGLKEFNSKQKNKKGPRFSAVLSVGTGSIEIQ